jgi:hypothetical protein
MRTNPGRAAARTYNRITVAPRLLARALPFDHLRGDLEQGRTVGVYDITALSGERTSGYPPTTCRDA